MSSKNGLKTGGDTRFKPGNPGGPGRSQGSRNKATLAFDKLAEGAGKEIIEKLIQAAKGGDLRAVEIVAARIWPPRKGRRVDFSLPDIKTASDVLEGHAALLRAVSSGDITPEEGQVISAILNNKREAIATVELEKRLTALESANTAKGH